VIKLTLKSTLKSIKLNESTISMVLGAIVIIVVGLLVVNYFKGLDQGTTLPTGEQTEVVQGPTISREGQTYHVVQANDNLWKIAERYYDSGYNWVPNVPPRQTTVVLSSNTTIEEPTGNMNPISGATYEVVAGDNLWEIAVRAYGDGYRWVDIARENNLVNPNIIHPGNILSLPR